MKALLLKDFYVIVKQMKIFLLLIVVFAFIPHFSMAVFSVGYAAMLPFTALAYDERSQWDTLARMLPYTSAASVLDKYVLGYLMMFGAAVISLLGGAVNVSFFQSGSMAETLQAVGFGALIGLLFLSIELPFVYRFGIEKGRLVFLGLCALTGGIVGGLFGIGGNTASLFSGVSSTLLMGIICTAVAVIHLLSILLSIHFYKNKK